MEEVNLASSQTKWFTISPLNERENGMLQRSPRPILPRISVKIMPETHIIIWSIEADTQTMSAVLEFYIPLSKGIYSRFNILPRMPFLVVAWDSVVPMTTENLNCWVCCFLGLPHTTHFAECLEKSIIILATDVITSLPLESTTKYSLCPLLTWH